MTIEELEQAGVRAAALVFVDNAGITRMKCVPLDRLARAAETGVGMSIIWGRAMGNDLFAPMPGDTGPSGELRLVADLDAAAAPRSTPGWAWAPVDQREQDGRPWEGCQRTFLRRMVERAASRGVELLAAWELEWTVVREGPGGLEPFHRGPGYSATTFPDTHRYMLEIVEAGSGLGIEQIHPEYSPGQMELSLSPRDPLRACDDSLLARHVARAVAGRDGLRASFAPIVASSVGNGQHIHFSVWMGGESQFAGGDGPAGLRPAGESFLAGVLAHLPALTALGAPSAVSYLRLQPSRWAGAYTCWGVENREAALRLEGTGGPNAARTANVELKCVDGAANPYLVVGGIIAAGVDGLDRGLRLPPPVSADPAELSEEERRAGAIARLPQTLAAAAEALAASAAIEAGIGGYLHDCVVAVRRGEAEAAAGLSEAELIESHRWRY